jgi:hypothetical protein
MISLKGILMADISNPKIIFANFLFLVITIKGDCNVQKSKKY